MTQVQLPYFDYLLSELGKNNTTIATSFGRHVHWGYWEDPAKARFEDTDYARAAEQLTLELCNLSGITEGERVLDVGCGFGGTIASLNERYNNLQLTGLNIDARQLERARSIVTPLAGNTVAFEEGDACKLPFADASFDRVLAVECIFHFPSREDFFREAFRVLRPGGVLVLSDFVPSPLFLPICITGRLKLFAKYNAFGDCNVEFTVGRYRSLAKRTGLESMVERNITLNTLPTWSYLQHMLGRRSPNGEASPMFRAMLAINRWLGSSGLMNYYLLSFRKAG